MGRAVLLGWLGLGLGLAAFAACLPEVTVDEALGAGGGPETRVGAEKDGSGGSAGKGPSSAGAGGGAGTAGIPNNPGSGGTAGTGSTEPAGGMAGAAVMTPSNAGTGGAAGMGGTGSAAAGAAGTSGAAGAPPAMGRCETNQSREEACGNYCQMYSDACSNFAGVYTYTDVLGCTDICNNSDWPIGNITEKGSVLCRCYHAYRALTEGQTPHCYHAAEVPSMPNGCAP